MPAADSRGAERFPDGGAEKILTTGIYSSLEYPHRDLTAWLRLRRPLPDHRLRHLPLPIKLVARGVCHLPTADWNYFHPISCGCYLRKSGWG